MSTPDWLRVYMRLTMTDSKTGMQWTNILDSRSVEEAKRYWRERDVMVKVSKA